MLSKKENNYQSFDFDSEEYYERIQVYMHEICQLSRYDTIQGYFVL